VDPQLGDIVLVKKNEMETWQARQTKLKQDLESTKRKVDSKIKECKARYKQQFEEI